MEVWGKAWYIGKKVRQTDRLRDNQSVSERQQTQTNSQKSVIEITINYLNYHYYYNILNSL